ncbi:hypothetical protein BD410DRAFT_450951 [Rickenella mellea]|uniref:NACHT domain-containing protein n=1 Tax=Rickenella mellea TaxID=50990 RepID=A0A4Y7PWZ9_9AGAM|nr:hypothetical protein BD410DRAFT_450951 [Rickenella mellea]
MAQFFSGTGNAAKISDHYKNLDRIIADLHTTVTMEIGNGVETITSIVRDLLDKAVSKDLDTSFNALPRVNGAPYNSKERDFQRGCLEGTREDILLKVHEWADNDSPLLFWLNGLAGTGKTTIAHTIAEYYDKRGQLGASFFFSRDQQHRRETRHLFPTLALQLGGRFPPLKLKIAEAIQRERHVVDLDSRTQFKVLLLDPISAVYPQITSPIVIVLDALDECERTDSVAEIIQLLAVELRGFSRRLKFFVTSRPDANLLLTFASQEIAMDSRALVLHQIQPSIVDHDIKLFFSAKLSNIGTLLGNTTWPSNDDIDELVRMAGGLFIFASTVADFVRGSNVYMAKDRLSAILEMGRITTSKTTSRHPFLTLDGIYLQILNSVESLHSSVEMSVSPTFQLVVRTIVTLFERLSCRDMASLLNSSESTVRSSLLPLHSVVVVPEGDGAVQIFHPSFRDYLTDRERCAEDQFYVHAPSHHATLTTLCIDRMVTILDKIIFELLTTSECDMPDDVRYSCRHWLTHLTQCDSNDEVDSRVLKLASDSKWHRNWTVALGLICDTDEAMLCLRQAAEHGLTCSTDEPTFLLKVSDNIRQGSTSEGLIDTRASTQLLNLSLTLSETIFEINYGATESPMHIPTSDIQMDRAARVRPHRPSVAPRKALWDVFDNIPDTKTTLT